MVFTVTFLAKCATATVIIVAVGWLVMNDSTVIGFIDNVLLPFLVPVVKKVFAS